MGLILDSASDNVGVEVRKESVIISDFHGGDYVEFYLKDVPELIRLLVTALEKSKK